MAERPTATQRIVVLAGDGIGPEIVAAARRVLDALGTFGYDEQLIGGVSIDELGTPLTDDALAACRRGRRRPARRGRRAEVGHHRPRRPATRAGAARPPQGPRACTRTCARSSRSRRCIDASPLRRERIEGTDLLVVRELTGGIYFGRKDRRSATRPLDECVYTTRRGRADRRGRVRRPPQRRAGERRRAGHLGRQGERPRDLAPLARGRQRRRPRLPDVELDHLLVDNAAMQLVSDPSQFDVIVTENMFGDILSDEAAMITGSLGMLPSASLGDGGPGVFEPVHGSAPDIAGQGAANPLATFLSVAMMLRARPRRRRRGRPDRGRRRGGAGRRAADRRPVHRRRRRTPRRHRGDDRSRDRRALSSRDRGRSHPQ